MRSLTGTIAIWLCVTAAAGQTPSFDLVGFAPGNTSSVVLGLSQDGSVGVGASGGVVSVAFRWTAAGGREDYGLLPGMPAQTWAKAVSSNGTVIAGSIAGNPIESASVRIGSGLVQDLGILPNHHSSRALAVSGDGTIVVGQNMAGSGTNYTSGQAFMWTAQTGMQPMPHLRPGGSLTQARGISRDGTTIVGMSQFGGTGGPIEAFRWTQSGGMVPLPTLPGAPTYFTQASAASADGSVIVGNAKSTTIPQSYDHAVRWTVSGVEDLGVLPGGTNSYSWATSDNGLVVGGICRVSQVEVPFVWSPLTGMIPLADHLASSGVIIPQGWTLYSLWTISGAGLTFAGSARSGSGDRQGFVATVAGFCYPNCDGSAAPPVLNVSDFVCFLTRFAAGDPYANCDGSNRPPILNVADFVCFQTKFAAGCP